MSTPRSRTRKRIVSHSAQYLGQLTQASGPTQYYTGTATYTNSCIDELHPGPPYRAVGPLSISKRDIKRGFTAPARINKYGSIPNYMYVGKFFMPSYIPNPEPTFGNIGGWGAVGWNRTVPVRPAARLGTALLELRDFPGMLKGTWEFLRKLPKALPFAKKGVTIGDFVSALRVSGRDGLSSDYLNLQFGWVPFVSDLLDVIHGQEKVAKKLAYLKKNDRKVVHRTLQLDKQEYSELIPNSLNSGFTTLSPVLPTQLYEPVTPVHQTIRLKTYVREIWYSARYTYHIPQLDLRADDPIFGSSPISRHLLGLELSPTTIYKAVPWTWLLDWFTNAGSVVENIELTARYHVVTLGACVMMREHYEYKNTGSHQIRTGDWVNSADSVKRRDVATSVTTYDFKQREVAHPYGFGVLDADLNAFQWSILAALGLSRLR